MQPLIRPGAFPILLAHHPHAFDYAAAANVPLTLAGHTHGGQLMLTKNIGFGPMMFRYWTGLYQRGDNALVVSNGVGNWFPLRTRAPAEIIHITLKRPATGATSPIHSAALGQGFSPGNGGWAAGAKPAGAFRLDNGAAAPTTIGLR